MVNAIDQRLLIRVIEKNLVFFPNFPMFWSSSKFCEDDLIHCFGCGVAGSRNENGGGSISELCAKEISNLWWLGADDYKRHFGILLSSGGCDYCLTEARIPSIRNQQVAQGNFPCFGTRKPPHFYCDQANCIYISRKISEEEIIKLCVVASMAQYPHPRTWKAILPE